MTNELLTENFLHGRIEKITCQSKKIYLLRLKRLKIFIGLAIIFLARFIIQLINWQEITLKNIHQVQPKD